MNNKLIDLVESKFKAASPPVFRIGDTVSVHVKIKEGDKFRVQQFIGVVIAHKGRGLNQRFSVRRIVANEGVERTFILHSPVIAKVEVLSSGKVRRAKLFYLRDRVGKSRKLRSKIVHRTDDETRDATSTSLGNSSLRESELAPIEA